MTREERIDKVACSIFATLYGEYGYGETSAWNEAYKRADKMVK